MPFKKVIKTFLFGCLISWFAGACAPKKDEADIYIEKARQSMETGQYQHAKKYIDSIRIVFPKNYTKIKEGIVVLREVEYAEQKRTKEYCDSLLRIRQAEFPDKQKCFVFQQNKAYESIGYYVHVKQLQKNNHDQTYIQAKVDERGKMVLISYYAGERNLGHNKIRVYAPNDSYAETEIVPRDGALNYAFQDSGLYYEIVRFNERKINNILDFMSMHEGEKLRVVLMGDKNKKQYTMQENDKKAIISAAELSLVLSDITILLDEIRLSQAKMNYILSKRDDSVEISMD